MTERVITVVKKEQGKNGGFKITDTEGNLYMVGVKNEAVAEYLIEGRASKVETTPYGTATYINKAELFDPSKPAEDKQVPEPRPQLQASEKEPAVRPDIPAKAVAVSKNGSYALSYAKDMAVAGVIDRKEILSWAKAFQGFLDGHITVLDNNVFREALTNAKYKWD